MTDAEKLAKIKEMIKNNHKPDFDFNVEHWETGTANGPCKGKCRCRACVFLKRLSKELCRFCDKKIGYNTPLFVEDWGVYVHWKCLKKHYGIKRYVRSNSR